MVRLFSISIVLIVFSLNCKRQAALLFDNDNDSCSKKCSTVSIIAGEKKDSLPEISPKHKYGHVLECALRNPHFDSDRWLKSDLEFPSALHPGRISPFDHIIKKVSRRYGFDWRLIAAQIFVESRFDSTAESKCGAGGLMQVMPKTSRYLGINPAHLQNPEINIGIGCLYNSKLLSQWKKDVNVDEHRLAFTLASYNAGRGRVLKSFRKSDSLTTWTLVHPDLPLETQNYVHRIVLKYNFYSKHILP
jgi:hypothetical protein